MDLSRLYETMLTARLLEDRLQALCLRGEAGDLHFSKGQEAISTGVCAALRPTDLVVTHHRTIAHEVARGADLYPLVAEVLGKRTGLCGGRAGEMQLANPTIGHAFSIQLIATCIPVAVGLAWTELYHHKTGNIVAVFHGDAATANGQFHEACNLAALHKVPLLFVVEANGRAGNITPEHYQPVQNVAERFRGYGIEGVTIDGNDLEHVVGTARIMAGLVRSDPGPRFLVCNTERLCWHKQGQRDIRTPAELADAARGDPLLKVALQLEKESSTFDHFTLCATINQTLDEVFARVAHDPLPEVFYDS